MEAGQVDAVAMRLAQRDFSLDARLGEGGDGDTTFLAQLPDAGQGDAEAQLGAAQERRQLQQAVGAGDGQAERKRAGHR